MWNQNPFLERKASVREEKKGTVAELSQFLITNVWIRLRFQSRVLLKQGRVRSASGWDSAGDVWAKLGDRLREHVAKKYLNVYGMVERGGGAGEWEQPDPKEDWLSFVVGGDYYKYIQNTYKKLEKWNVIFLTWVKSTHSAAIINWSNH